MRPDIRVTGDTLVARQMLAAPIDKVFAAWVDPAQMSQWLIPNERWRQPEIDAAPRPGGRHNIMMHHSNGRVFRNMGRYLQIAPNTGVSFTWAWPDDPAGWPESLVTAEFRQTTVGTELSLTHNGLTDPRIRKETAEAWKGCLAYRDTYLQEELAPAA